MDIKRWTVDGLYYTNKAKQQKRSEFAITKSHWQYKIKFHIAFMNVNRLNRKNKSNHRKEITESKKKKTSKLVVRMNAMKWRKWKRYEKLHMYVNRCECRCVCVYRSRWACEKLTVNLCFRCPNVQKANI